ncbi:MAG: type VI secretion system contractile sheath large subunit [Gammaproteobacteria bacterium]
MSEDKQQDAAQAAQGEHAEGDLLDELAEATGITRSTEGFDKARRGIEELVRIIVRDNRTEERVQGGLIDNLVAEIDKKVGSQIDEVIHNDSFQKLESAWTGLKYLVDKTDFRENCRLEILNVSKQDLSDDFQDAPEIPMCGLYNTVYNSEFGVFGGEAYGTIIGNYEFGAGAADLSLLGNIASVSAMAHAPFFAAAQADFFPNMDGDFQKLSNLKDLDGIFEGPQYAKWRGFRETEDARYVGLTLPRFMLRQPYDPEENPVKDFNYEENIDGQHDNYLWGNASFAFASRLTDSFAKYRWCSDITGPEGGGAVYDLPVHNYEAMGEVQTKIPTETLITEGREYELANHGFIPLTMRKNSDNAAFFSANSVQKAKRFSNTPEGKAMEANYKLGTRFPYMFLINRLAHYVKVMQREKIGSGISRDILQRQLSEWLNQYVSAQENPKPGIMSRYPLKEANVEVEDIVGEPGWYKVSINVSPHFKYEGADFEMSLVAKEKAEG